MRKTSLFAVGLATAVLCITLASPTQAQTRTRAQAQTVVQPPQQKCLRALDGSCTNPAIVEAARLRAVIIPSVRVSYFGTPAGTVGGDYIPFERLFRDNDVVFGLPTNTFFCAACGTFTYSK
jgi:hypothetical protein